MIRIVLADDHAMVRTGIKMILEKDPAYKVVAEAADGTQAYAVVAREMPDLLLMDVSMSTGQNGLVACERITKDFPKTKVVILTMFAETEYLLYALQGGASGYILKNATSDELALAVRTVMKGEHYISPKMRDLLEERLASQEDAEEDRSYQALSGRELEILQLLAKGYTNKEISEKMFLSIKTVEANRSRIYAKLGFASRAELVDYAIRHKLLDI